jgi:hypothetical protein
MKALDFLLPAKGSALSGGDETPEFRPAPAATVREHGGSAISSETFDALMNRALAEPSREREENFYAAKKSPATTVREHGGSAASRSSRAAKNDASVSRKSKPAECSETQSASASHSTDHNERSIRDTANEKRKEDSSSEDSAFIAAKNSDQSIAAGPVPTGDDAAATLQTLAAGEAVQTCLQTSAAAGACKTAGVGEGNNPGAANAATQISIPTTASGTPENAKKVSEKMPQPGANESPGEMKEIPASSGESAKNSGSADGGIPIQALLDKAEIGKEPASIAANSAVGKPHPASSETAGISAAQQDATMKKTDNAPIIAGQSEQNLPGVTVVAAEQSAARAKSVAKSDARVESLETTANSSAVDRTSAASETSSNNLLSAPAQTDLRVRALDRTHDMVALHGMRLKESNADSLHVVIKPGAGLQLSLQLKQTGEGIEARAVLQHGDFNQLNQHWAELQQRLGQRGIQLAPLGYENSTPSNSNENFQRQQKQPAKQDSLAAGTFAGLADVRPAIAARAVRSAVQRGWESWA